MPGAAGGTGTVAQSRGLTLFFGAAAALVAIVMHDVISALTVAYNLLVGAIFVPIIAAMFFKRGNEAAALVSTVASAIVVVVLMVIRGIDSTAPLYGGLLSSLVLFTSVSLWARQRGYHDGQRARDQSGQKRATSDYLGEHGSAVD